MPICPLGSLCVLVRIQVVQFEVFGPEIKGWVECERVCETAKKEEGCGQQVGFCSWWGQGKSKSGDGLAGGRRPWPEEVGCRDAVEPVVLWVPVDSMSPISGSVTEWWCTWACSQTGNLHLLVPPLALTCVTAGIHLSPEGFPFLICPVLQCNSMNFTHNPWKVFNTIPSTL